VAVAPPVWEGHAVHHQRVWHRVGCSTWWVRPARAAPRCQAAPSQWVQPPPQWGAVLARHGQATPVLLDLVAAVVAAVAAVVRPLPLHAAQQQPERVPGGRPCWEGRNGTEGVPRWTVWQAHRRRASQTHRRETETETETETQPQPQPQPQTQTQTEGEREKSERVNVETGSARAASRTATATATGTGTGPARREGNVTATTIGSPRAPHQDLALDVAQCPHHRHRWCGPAAPDAAGPTAQRHQQHWFGCQQRWHENSCGGGHDSCATSGTRVATHPTPPGTAMATGSRPTGWRTPPPPPGWGTARTRL